MIGVPYIFDATTIKKLGLLLQQFLSIFLQLLPFVLLLKDLRLSLDLLEDTNLMASSTTVAFVSKSIFIEPGIAPGFFPGGYGLPD
jgi:hypothetical protein